MNGSHVFGDALAPVGAAGYAGPRPAHEGRWFHSSAPRAQEGDRDSPPAPPRSAESLKSCFLRRLWSGHGDDRDRQPRRDGERRRCGLPCERPARRRNGRRPERANAGSCRAGGARARGRPGRGRRRSRPRALDRAARPGAGDCRRPRRCSGAHRRPAARLGLERRLAGDRARARRRLGRRRPRARGRVDLRRAAAGRLPHTRLRLGRQGGRARRVGTAMARSYGSSAPRSGSRRP